MTFLTYLYLSFNEELHLIDQKEIFKGFAYLKNVNISYELLDNLSSIFILKNSIYGTRQIVRELGERKFYQAIYFVYDLTNESLTYSLQDCFKVLYLLRWNIHLNLKYTGRVLIENWDLDSTL
jgi:hypothetical protein